MECRMLTFVHRAEHKPLSHQVLADKNCHRAYRLRAGCPQQPVGETSLANGLYQHSNPVLHKMVGLRWVGHHLTQQEREETLKYR